MANTRLIQASWGGKVGPECTRTRAKARYDPLGTGSPLDHDPSYYPSYGPSHDPIYVPSNGPSYDPSYGPALALTMVTAMS